MYMYCRISFQLDLCSYNFSLPLCADLKSEGHCGARLCCSSSEMGTTGWRPDEPGAESDSNVGTNRTTAVNSPETQATENDECPQPDVLRLNQKSESIQR